MNRSISQSILKEHKSKRKEERLFSAFNGCRRFNKWPREHPYPAIPLFIKERGGNGR